MNEDECIEVFRTLNRILEEQGLGWLVEAVAREIQEGIIEEASEKDLAEELFEPSSAELAPAYRRSIRKAEFLIRREFSHADRLSLLVGAVEEVVSQGNDIEQDLLHFFKESDGPIEFQFADLQSSLILKSPEQLNRRASAVRQLRELLQELRREILR